MSHDNRSWLVKHSLSYVITILLNKNQMKLILINESDIFFLSTAVCMFLVYIKTFRRKKRIINALKWAMEQFELQLLRYSSRKSHIKHFFGKCCYEYGFITKQWTTLLKQPQNFPIASIFVHHVKICL